MAHIVVPEAEEVLDKEYPVLDHGFVRLVDYLGGDQRVVESARVSYGEGTRSVRDDEALINYLMRHLHTTPFEHIVLEFHCKMPIFVARQWIRHRTARVNEISGRYSVMTDEFYVPDETQVSYQSTDNKQGRATEEVPGDVRRKVLEILRQDQSHAYATYQELLNDNIARELARINLPLSLYTQWYWQIDFHNLCHFLNLRMDAHAQWEIRQYAHVIAQLSRRVAPLSYAAFERHIRNGCRLSDYEIDAVKQMIKDGNHALEGRKRRELNEKLGLD